LYHQESKEDVVGIDPKNTDLKGKELQHAVVLLCRQLFHGPGVRKIKKRYYLTVSYEENVYWSIGLDGYVNIEIGDISKSDKQIQP
jgi:hypothetical protein